jgi:hypothetical protein
VSHREAEVSSNEMKRYKEDMRTAIASFSNLVFPPLQVLLPRFLNMDNFTYTGQLRKEIRLAAALSGQEEAMASGSGTGHESACFYRLCSVIVHLGGVDSGHYVTYRRSAGADDRWFVVSDEVVEEVAETRVLQCPAYIVIYERCPRLSAQSPIMDPTSP